MGLVVIKSKIQQSVIRKSLLRQGTLRLSAEADPELFALARVGLGALGVVAEVTLQCVLAHQLLEHTFMSDLKVGPGSPIQKVNQAHMTYLLVCPFLSRKIQSIHDLQRAIEASNNSGTPSACHTHSECFGCASRCAWVWCTCSRGMQAFAAQEVKRQHARWLRNNRHLRYMWIPYTDAIVVVTNNPVREARPSRTTVQRCCRCTNRQHNFWRSLVVYMAMSRQ